jgi:hypothetical protein
MEQVPPIPALEHIKNDNLKRIGELVRNPELEELDAEDIDSAGVPSMLFLIIGLVLVSAAMMLLLFLTLGDQTVTNTLGNHFMR